MQCFQKLGLMLSLLVLMANTSVQAVSVTTYFHLDPGGSPLVATDEQGNVVWKQQYRPYGDKESPDNNAGQEVVGFHGKAHDDNTGLSYFGARYYSPTLGRFMSVDPVDVDPNNLYSFNRYAYGNNNPCKFSDPDGNEPYVSVMSPSPFSVSDSRVCKAGSCHGIPYTPDRRYATPLENEGLMLTLDVLTLAGGAVGSVSKASFRAVTSTIAADTNVVFSSAQEAYKGSTVVGHALSKHAGRNPELWGTTKGAMNTWNEQGMTQLRDVIQGPGKFTKQTYDNGLDFLEKRLPDGRGVRLNVDSTFKGFLD